MRLSLSRSFVKKFSYRLMSSSTTEVTPIPGPNLGPEKKGVGVESKFTKDKYLNPLLTPPPRSPRTPEDFRHPEQLGHWFTYGYDWTNPKVDKYLMHESFFMLITVGIFTLWIWAYTPDFKLKDWARREAFFRTHKREALGLPLIDPNVVDPERIVLPTEEELGDYPVSA